MASIRFLNTQRTGLLHLPLSLIFIVAISDLLGELN